MYDIQICLPSLTSLCLLNLQVSAKECALGCVKSAPTARGGQGAGITQPRNHSLADPCMYCLCVNFGELLHLSPSNSMRMSFMEAPYDTLFANMCIRLSANFPV